MPTDDLPTVALPTEDRSDGQNDVGGTPSAAALPERIGRYRILGQIGEGGFGVVYEAQQTEPVTRRVALKVIKLGMDTKQVIARFEAERQALALMDHPHIAKVLDAGATESGRPFFVMEIVRGDPITDYCDKNNLSIEARLILFQQVCKAVQHAHQKGVIHRDIKPSNVLLTMHDGTLSPKVIDFGIAKATSARLTEKTVFTQQRQLIGTPQYMSPEQAEMSGIDIDTRSDIYSLGVLLYELLTGVTPFDAQELLSAGYSEIQRLIREKTPAKPSLRLSSLDTAEKVAQARHTEPRKLGSLIRGDLDWIVMKALEKDRTRRYETANGFAEDIQRYLNSEPTLATPPSTAYRLRKFVRRNRVGVAAAALVAAALVLAVVGTTWGMKRATASAEAEAVARAEAEQLADFQASMLEQIDPATAGVRLTADVIERYREALAAAGLEEEVEITERAESFRAEWRRINATDAALALIDETILTPAVAAIDRQFADQPLVDARLRQVMAVRYRSLGLLDPALPLQERVLEIRRRELGEEHLDTLASVSEHVRLLIDMGRYEDAAPLAREALETTRRALGGDHPGTLKSISNLGTLLQYQGKLAEAEPFFREVVEGRRRTQGDDHPDTLVSINNLGLLLEMQGKFADAEVLLRESLDGKRRTLGDDHPSTLFSVNNMGLLLQRQARLDEAEPYYREALAGNRRALGDDHPTTLISIGNMGMLLQGQGKLAEAEVLLREALETRRRVAGDDNPQTLMSISNLGFFLHAQGRLDEAAPFYRRALETRRRTLGDDHMDTLVSISNMARLHRDRGRLDEAERGLREAVATARRALGEEHPYTLIFTGYLGRVLAERGRREAAIALLSPVETPTRAAFTGGNAHRLALLLSALGSARAGGVYDAERFAQAEADLLEAHALYLDTPNADNEDTRECAESLIDLYAAWHAAEPGAGYDAKAEEWRIRVMEPDVESNEQ